MNCLYVVLRNLSVRVQSRAGGASGAGARALHVLLGVRRRDCPSKLALAPALAL